MTHTIERDELIAEEGWTLCERCAGTGAVDAPYSGSDPSCPKCSGQGAVEE